MATEAQTKYIIDLAVKKTKEFKEVKELLVSSGVVGPEAETVAQAGTLAEIGNALTDQQASRFIEVLIATQEPKRDRAYSTGRVRKTVAILDDIEKTVADWGF